MAIFLLLIGVVLLPLPSAAESVLTVRCEEPKGLRYDYGPPPEAWFSSEKAPAVLEQSDDGFKGARPVFVIDSTSPEQLTVVWGDNDLFGDLATTRAEAATIVMRSDDHLAAIERKGESIWMYSLYPKIGAGFFTRHRSLKLFPVADAATFFSKCVFA
jgi:hypothetical protein